MSPNFAIAIESAQKAFIAFRDALLKSMTPAQRRRYWRRYIREEILRRRMEKLSCI